MRQRVLVTGASGFIGRSLVRSLVAAGYQTRCLIRPTSEVSFLMELGVELAYGDVRDTTALLRAVKGVGVVFHLAGQVSVAKSLADPQSAFLTNTMGTLNLLEAIKEAEDSRPSVIYLSSDRVYGNPGKEMVRETDLPLPLEPYGASKLCGEHLCRAFGHAYSIPFLILRGAHVYGPGQPASLLISSIIRQILSEDQQEVRVGNTETHRNFVYLSDMVAALLLALQERRQAAGGIFNIGAGCARIGDTVQMLLELSARFLGKRAKLVEDPSLVRAAGLEGERFELDCSKARKVLGWSPLYLIEQGLEATFRAFLKEMG